MIKNLLQIFVFALFLCFETTAIAGTILDAERAVGRLRLGMQEREFQRVTGIKVGPCPGDCKKEEEFADFECAAKPKVCEGVPEVTGVDVFFWKKKIYFMTAGVKEIPLNMVKKHFSNRFGEPSWIYNQGTPGLKLMEWRNNNTMVTATFSVGDNMVSSISFKDLSRDTTGAGW